MKLYLSQKARMGFYCLAISVLPSACASATSEIIAPEASIISSLEEISHKQNKKSEIARKLPRKIGNMALHKVADYQKRIIIGQDLGYGIFYDLKAGKKGSGNIFLYTRDGQDKTNGLTDESLEELLFEQSDIQKAEAPKGIEKQVTVNGLPFYRTEFLTPPDGKNDQYICHMLITTYNNVYVKIVFYYPKGSGYANAETDKFLKAMTAAIKA